MVMTYEIRRPWEIFVMIFIFLQLEHLYVRDICVMEHIVGVDEGDQEAHS